MKLDCVFKLHYASHSGIMFYQMNNSSDLQIGERQMAQVKQITQIPEDASFSNSLEFLSGKKVKSTFSFRQNATSPRYAKEVTYDFSGLNERQLLELAVRTVQIKVQAMLRALDPAVMLDATVLTEVDVLRDVINSEKKTADPDTKAIRSLMAATNCSEEVAREMMNAAKKKAEQRKAEGQKVEVLPPEPKKSRKAA